MDAENLSGLPKFPQSQVPANQGGRVEEGMTKDLFGSGPRFYRLRPRALYFCTQAVYGQRQRDRSESACPFPGALSSGKVHFDQHPKILPHLQR